MRLKTFATFAASSLLLTASLGMAQAKTSAFSDKDKSFLKEIAEGNLGEIKMAELALKTSKNADVRGFAEKMVTDHRALLAGAQPVAAKAGVTLPTHTGAEEEAVYLKLKVLSGDTFDKSYVKSMVSDHHEDNAKIKEEHDTTANPSMKKLTAHAGEVTGEHTRMIEAIAAKMGVQ